MAKEDLSGIKNIIIDVGGVIIDIDYNLTAKAFIKLGVENFEDVFAQAKQMGFVDEFEKGNLSPDEFRNQLRQLSGKNFTDTEIDTAWDSLILFLKPSKIEVLRKLSQNYKLYLLSNNNAIHYQQCIVTVNKVIPFEEFSNLFLKNYYSHQIHLRKPDKEIFEFVLTENNLIAAETLFLDDSIQHIESAKKLGISTITVSGENTIEKIFG